MLGSWQSLYHCILHRIGHLPLASPDRGGSVITPLAWSFAGGGNAAARFSCWRLVLNESADLRENRVRELRQELNDSELVEGENLSSAYHRAEERNERMRLRRPTWPINKSNNANFAAAYGAAYARYDDGRVGRLDGP